MSEPLEKVVYFWSQMLERNVAILVTTGTFRYTQKYDIYVLMDVIVLSTCRSSQYLNAKQDLVLFSTHVPVSGT